MGDRLTGDLGVLRRERPDNLSHADEKMVERMLRSCREIYPSKDLIFKKRDLTFSKSLTLPYLSPIHQPTCLNNGLAASVCFRFLLRDSRKSRR